MEDTQKESADKEKMDIHTPAYPLPIEIQQMDHLEKACRYCGVSYLILHEFQRLQERLQEVEKELERERGSVERERAVREELQQAYTHLDKMKAAVFQQEETTRALDLQLCVVRHKMESVRTDKERACTELENERARRLHLRWRCKQQQQVLNEALALLQSSRGEMMTIKSRFAHFLENWEDSKALIQQSCIRADADFLEHARLQKEVDGMEAELKRLQGEVPNLRLCLDAAQEEILQLESQLETQQLLQNQNQEAHSLILGLREEVKTLKNDLQNNMHQQEHVKKLLETKSNEKEELQELWSQQTRDQKAAMDRLSRDLREKEESWLSCQQRCESLQEQLLAWQQKEEEVTRRLEGAEGELKDLRAARFTLQQEREELRRIHVAELERLETRLKEAEEHSSKIEARLEQKQAEQLKRLEMELRREADMELDIHRQKNQELLQKYQSENQQLQKKIPALLSSATQELQEELMVLQERIKQQEAEVQHARESASQRKQQVLQERRAEETQLQSALQDLQQAQKNLQQLREEKATLEEQKCFLEETVRRECEEREELTLALTQAREQLLDLKHLTTKPHDTHTHTRLSISTAAHPDLPSSKPTLTLLHPHPRKHSTPPPQGTRRRGLAEFHSGSVSRSVASWHGTSRPVSTLPKISKERIPTVNENISSLFGRRDKL